MIRRGRPRKYTQQTLRQAVERYFDSISREQDVTEMLPTGELDKYGHPVFRPEPVRNRLGEIITEIRFFVPPTVGGLCDALGITRETWSQWQDAERFPEFADTVTRARARMRAWNEQELLTRSGKDVKGIIFNLENNYGYRERHEIGTDGKTAAACTAAAAMTMEEKLQLLEELRREAAQDADTDG